MSLKQCMHLVLATVILLRCLVWSGAFGYVPPPGEMLGSSTYPAPAGVRRPMPRSAKMGAESAAQAAGGPQSRTSTRYSQVLLIPYFFVVLFLSVTAAAFEVREHLGTSENR